MNLMTTILALFLSAGLAFASNPGDTQTKAQTPARTEKVTKAEKKKAAKVSKRKPQIGAASWYGKGFQGRPTASGEAYDMYQFTAAHRNLPLGSWVKVTNLKNGKWLIVKVNDRGPYVGNRIMDLSYSAAQTLDFKSQGLAKVKLEVVQPEVVGDSTVANSWPLD